MAQVKFVSLLVLVLLACLVMSSFGDDYVQDACSVTRYRDLCVHSLASFSNTAKRSPSKWARAGVSVTIREVKGVARYLAALRRGRHKIALSDCVECFQDTLDNLHRSLGVLRKLSVTEFSSQVGDVTTWVSAALTDEDTCLDEFQEQKGKRVRGLINRVTNVTYMTSNALALVNRLATTGPECLLSN
ncbi:Plant invertase/pectin methylesterase inhibitor superfamily protein [Perilla frutescens var. hirtella]|uniref:Plant invertase/pectin methylesterase inhibitor superfamily protein n=1 Tax=Perilla frutescens var. hirtella TaxID=608512 RepID=A0AAD4IYU3_PERFH|nr:Plant invertase/pectin methylesterase inhibitor superfamily protein [Perilla frutescens var. hirtella]